VVEVGEFAADRPGADDRQALGLGREGHRLAVAYDLLAVEGREGELGGAGADGDDDVLGGDVLGFSAGGGGEAHLVGGGDLGRAGFVLDAVFGEEGSDSALELDGDAAGSGDDLAEVDLKRIHDDAALGRAVAQMADEGAVLKKGLGGDASPVKADAA